MTRSSLRGFASFIALALALAACGAPVEYDARALDVPFVDQYDPEGKRPGYDGSPNCGPAVLAGIAKARDQAGGQSDAALIHEMAEVAGTDEEGTSGNGMVAGLEWLAMEWDATPGADLAWIDGELLAGHVVIACGDFYAIPGREEPGLHSGHYIAVTAVRDDWSVYEVMDPAGREITELTDVELPTFIASHPGQGFAISGW
jgi:hypothetical protein